MSDGNRSGYGDNAAEGGIARRTEGAFDRYDDPNRGPLDRAANAITGGSGGLDGALHRDNPNKGPFDRTENALSGHDDPNRGPLDRTANAVTGGVGGVSAARAGTSRGTGRTVSAIFDTEAGAQRAVADLRSAGVSDSALSVIARSNGTTTARNVDGEITDEHDGSIARGVLGGGALGAGLGVLALAIPGVGPLVAAGAIAASAVPGAMAIGAAAGAAAGTFNEVLKSHGISDEDASYYGERLTAGGVVLTVDATGANANVSDILRRNGGHNVSNPRTTAL